MGFDIKTSDDEYTGYLSYNHLEFSEYWHIWDHLEDQNGATVLANLKTGLTKLHEAGFEPVMLEGQDCWRATENVFMYLLKRMHDQIEAIIQKWPDHADAIYTVS